MSLYRGCVDGERGYDKVGCQRPRYGGFSVPLIAQFTGARADEICQPKLGHFYGDECSSILPIDNNRSIFETIVQFRLANVLLKGIAFGSANRSRKKFLSLAPSQ
ncbi:MULTISPECIES: hypothetical protein [unclassified Sphingobium]|uniref:hypothetical protein n=1 Tax=unclassified Sphingobium TaxID=2611147 RepID=UPI0035A677E6